MVGVSIGSSRRDHRVVMDFFGEPALIERVGTDGSMEAAIKMIRELDGKVDAIGLGGIDLYFTHKNRRWIIKDAAKLAHAARITPVVDGSGMKNTLERQAVEYVARHTDLLAPGKKALVMSCVDRPGMAEAVWNSGAETAFGDLIFGLKIPIPIKSYKIVDLLALTLLPVITRMPFEKLYPTGEKQETREPERFKKFFLWADVVAGDLNFIKRYIPDNMDGRSVITNSTTPPDHEFLRSIGIKSLITTTPEFEGRTFGTNVIEALMVAYMGKPLEEISSRDYQAMVDKLNFTPRVREL